FDQLDLDSALTVNSKELGPINLDLKQSKLVSLKRLEILLATNIIIRTEIPTAKSTSN
ncbi:hypothetical protein GIB67_010281, partial [Kingdonia uniflora]